MRKSVVKNLKTDSINKIAMKKNLHFDNIYAVKWLVYFILMHEI